LNSSFTATVTQPLLQGAGIFVNKRYVYQALNNRRITDSTFRQQILFTVNQVENIYWGLVNAYEDVQAKERALEQTSKSAADNRKQLEIGTMAPLDVLNADQAVASDKQALISSQTALNFQQQIIKQAIARNLNDPALVAAAVIPTDRVSLEEIPEEKQPIEERRDLAEGRKERTSSYCERVWLLRSQRYGRRAEPGLQYLHGNGVWGLPSGDGAFDWIRHGAE
jgi:outer membrane protein TolC